MSGDQVRAAIAREDFRWLLGSLCALRRQAFDPDLTARDFPPPFSRLSLHEAARRLGFKTGRIALAGLDWQCISPILQCPPPTWEGSPLVAEVGGRILRD